MTTLNIKDQSHDLTITTPHRMYRWCKSVLNNLYTSALPCLIKGQDPGLLYYYPNVQALFNGSHKANCYLCSILAGSIALRQVPNGIE